MLRGIFTLLIISVVSGIIAFLGNRLGRYFGKKRLTIFNLRPRHTATIFTILTGILISMLTIGVSSMLSKNVRIALFGMEKLQQERLQLQEEINRLSAQVSQGKILFTAGQPIVINVIDGGTSKLTAKNRLENLLQVANVRAVAKYNLLADYYNVEAIPLDTELITYNPEQLDRAADTISGSKENWGVTISASNNVFLEGKFNVNIKVIKNIAIYHKDDEISLIKIDTSLADNEILADLFTLIYNARENIFSRGMMQDPEQQLSMPSAEALGEFVNRIKQYHGWVLVKALAKRDLYVVDAPDIHLTLESTTPPE
ncbi:MAG: DUF3084 domain-containing protein [Armatimonadota bacterium]